MTLLKHFDTSVQRTYKWTEVVFLTGESADFVQLRTVDWTPI